MKLGDRIEIDTNLYGTITGFDKWGNYEVIDDNGDEWLCEKIKEEKE